MQTHLSYSHHICASLREAEEVWHSIGESLSRSEIAEIRATSAAIQRSSLMWLCNRWYVWWDSTEDQRAALRHGKNICQWFASHYAVDPDLIRLSLDAHGWLSGMLGRRHATFSKE